MLFPRFQFLLPFLRTTVISNNTDDRGPGPSKFNFCQSIKMYNPAEIEGFYHKSCYHGLSFNLFKNVMQ